MAIYFVNSAICQVVDYNADSANRLVMTDYYDLQNLHLNCHSEQSVSEAKNLYF